MRFSQFVQHFAQAQQLRKGEHFLRQGQAGNRLALLLNGTIKAYYLNHSGQEKIKSFFADGDLLGSLRASVEGIPAPFSLVAVEPCNLLAFDYQALKQRAQSDLELANDLNDALIQLAIKKEKREQAFLCLDAADRYRSLIKDHPLWLDRVTQNDIALYLGVTPVALSRIRGRMAKETRPD